MMIALLCILIWLLGMAPVAWIFNRTDAGEFLFPIEEIAIILWPLGLVLSPLIGLAYYVRWLLNNVGTK